MSTTGQYNYLFKIKNVECNLMKKVGNQHTKLVDIGQTVRK